MDTKTDEQMSFCKASFTHEDMIFNWLEEPHIKAFWDNSQTHRDDIINFMEGRRTASPYFDGIFDYWVGSVSDVPFCFLMTAEVFNVEGLSSLWQQNLSKKGHTYSIDFCIGNTDYFGKGYAPPALRAFTKFIREKVDPKANTFFIDPDENNPRAVHVYEKAGFKNVGDFVMEDGYFKGHKSLLLVLNLE